MLKPTIREVRLILQSIGQPLDVGHYNDSRKNGGRIKLCKLLNAEAHDMLQSTMSMLFPEYTFNVYIHDWYSSHYRGDTPSQVTCISWTEK